MELVIRWWAGAPAMDSSLTQHVIIGFHGTLAATHFWWDDMSLRAPAAM
jgi:hypothetical protein